MSPANAVAIFWDFENLHASLLDETMGQGAYLANRFRPQDVLVDVAAVVDFASSLGPIVINRAYGNWVSFCKYKHAMLRSALELVQLFAPGANAKNGADIRLCLDVMEDMARLPHIGTIIVVGGDSDYMPLSCKVKATGRKVVGIGTRGSTNQHWARSAHDFRFYDTLVETVAEEASFSAPQPLVEQPRPEAAPAVVAVDAAMPTAQQRDTAEPAAMAAAADQDLLAQADAQRSARDIVIKAVSLLSRGRDQGWIKKAGLLPFIQRTAPEFDQSAYGFATFSELLATMSDTVETRRGEFDHELRLRAPQVVPAARAA